jgi:hypothetical protein
MAALVISSVSLTKSRLFVNDRIPGTATMIASAAAAALTA